KKPKVIFFVPSLTERDDLHLVEVLRGDFCLRIRLQYLAGSGKFLSEMRPPFFGDFACHFAAPPLPRQINSEPRFDQDWQNRVWIARFPVGNCSCPLLEGLTRAVRAERKCSKERIQHPGAVGEPLMALMQLLTERFNRVEIFSFEVLPDRHDELMAVGFTLELRF